MRKIFAIAALLFLLSCKKDKAANNDNNNPGNRQPTSPSLQFKGDGGVYYLGTADVPLSASVFQNQNISGIVVRFRWETVEPSPGIYNWSFIDGEIAKAKAVNKKVSLQPLGYPSWVVSQLGAAPYNYINKNTNHTTYGDTLKDVISWDPVYISRVNLLIQQLAAKYANDTTVAYCNLIAGQVSRGLPDTVITSNGPKPFYQAFAYHADTLAAKMKSLLDAYMSLFPKTPLWNSVDYVSFENRASGRPINYLASQYVSYGVQKYPDRFGCWREDLSGCNPQQSISSSSHWYILQQNPVRTGAQMLWSVQDGPSRMNRCGIAPSSKAAVLDSAVKNGLRLGMRYVEIYGADINDASLAVNIQQYNQWLKQNVR
jgi:hypothetical protein